MIENIRKYTGLLIVFFALVVVALVVGIKDDIFRGGSGGQAILKIAGRTYTDRDFQRMGSGSLELAQSLARSGEMGMFSFFLGLSSNSLGNEDITESFFINRMILRKAKEELGVQPGADQIDEQIRAMQSFQVAGKFDPETYSQFVNKALGRRGMTEQDLRELVSDQLAHETIKSIIGGSLQPNREISASIAALSKQSINGHLARIDIDPFEADAEPSEEELKAYWETIQDAFITEPMRQFTYLIATPDTPAETAETEETADSSAETDSSEKTDTEEVNDSPPNESKEADKEADKETKLTEAKRKLQLELDSRVDDFSFQLEEQQGTGFEELAKNPQFNFTTLSTEPFTRSAPPEALNLKLRSSAAGGFAVDLLFQIVATDDPVSKITQPIAVGENQWLIARLDQEIPARPKTYEEAKEEVRDRYIQEKASEAMRAAAEKAKSAIIDGLAAGQSFIDATKDTAVADAREFSKVSSRHTPDIANEPRTLFSAARCVNPGEFADLVVESDRIFIVHVASREVEKSPNAELEIDNAMKSSAFGNQNNAFTDWLNERVEAAQVERLYR